jgi:hypothetical protein
MRIATLALGCTALFLAACGNDNNAGGACTTAAPSGGPAFVGTVAFGVSPLSSGTDYNVDASVFPNFGQATQDASTHCPGTRMGSCCFVPNAQPCSLPNQASAGNITVSKGGQGFGELMFMDGYYNTLDSSNATSCSGSFSWKAGDTLSVNAAGAAAMAASFTGSVVAPSDVANVLPALTGTVSIPKSRDFVVTWTPGTGTAQVNVFLEDISLAAIGCTAPVTNGTVTVPAALIQKLGSAGSLGFSTVNSSSVVGSDAAIQLRASGTPRLAGTTYPAN